MKFPDRTFFLKDKQSRQNQKADTGTNYRRIRKTNQSDPHQDYGNTSGNACLDQIKQILLFFQMIHLNDHRHGAHNSHSPERKHKINRPASPAGKIIPQNSNRRDQYQLPHFILQNVSPFRISHGNNKPCT